MMSVNNRQGECVGSRAFTLVELMVVIGIISILMSLLLPALARVWESARKANCAANLEQVGLAIHTYSIDNNGRIPFGPKAPPIFGAGDFYPSTGAPTSLISLSNGAPVGLGLLLQNQLASQPKALFCPSSDDPSNADEELSHVGWQQAQCSYYYRHASVTRQFDTAALLKLPVTHIQLANMGDNRNGRRIRALALDVQFPAPSGFGSFGINPSTHHSQKFCNILFTDGHVVSFPNDNSKYTVDLSDYVNLTNAFDTMLKVFETADLAQ